MAFDGFDAKKMSHYDQKKVDELLQNEKIVRSVAKIKAAISNAQVFLDIQDQYGSFENYLHTFTLGKTYKQTEIITHNELSDALSKDLKKRGFKFMGSVTLYAYLQAIGIIDAHEKGCFKYQENE